MSISVGQIQFGELDAQHEIFQQGRYGSKVFHNSFQIPPKIDLDALIQGSRFFITGLKGSGKTALLLHVKYELDQAGAKTLAVLFKSDLTEPERQSIAAGQGFEIIENAGSVSVEYDYKLNWLWFILKSILRMIKRDYIFKGWDIVEDLQKLTGVYGEVAARPLSGLSFNKLKANATAGLNAGPFKTSLSAEVEALKKQPQVKAEIEIIDLCERYLTQVIFYPGKRCALFFDELELFWNLPDQRTRDLYLIRDLLYSVSRINRKLGESSASILVFASVRSEVMNEVNRVGPEIYRDVQDFGASVNWNVTTSADSQPILNIIEAKIRASEIEQDELPTQDVWNAYFPRYLYNKPIKQFILDISMFKPRNIVGCLTLAKEYQQTALVLAAESFEETQTEFASIVWREMEEELLGIYSADDVSSLQAVLTGFDARFSAVALEQRIQKISGVDPSIARTFRTREAVIKLLKSLYRIGAIGNSYFVKGPKGRKEPRDRWVFRGQAEPTVENDFVVHESLKKHFQMSFGG